MNSNNMTQRLKAARFNMTQRHKAAHIKRYRRFHGYDYSRGASIFVTFAVRGRSPLFGRVEGDKVVLSPAGRAALEYILFENRRPGRRVWAASFVVMPDHIHIRLVLEPDSGEEPLRHVGQFINNVKRWSRKHAAEIGVEVEWEPNYHDHICVSRFINEKVDAYIGYNPLKMVYRPHVEDTLAFAEGRLAVVSRECSPEMSRYDAWHGMNDAMAAMAAACGDGLGVYIHRKGARAAAAPVWERR